MGSHFGDLNFDPSRFYFEYFRFIHGWLGQPMNWLNDMAPKLGKTLDWVLKIITIIVKIASENNKSG